MTLHIRPIGSEGQFYGPHRDLAICGKYIVAAALNALESRADEFPEDIRNQLQQAGTIFVDAIFVGYKLPVESYRDLDSVLRHYGYYMISEEARQIFERELGVAFSHYLLASIRDAATLEPEWPESDVEIIRELTSRVLVNRVKILPILWNRLGQFLWRLIKKYVGRE